MAGYQLDTCVAVFCLMMSTEGYFKPRILKPADLLLRHAHCLGCRVGCESVRVQDAF